jgi:hypothetical protein
MILAEWGTYRVSDLADYVFAYWIPFPDDRVKLMLVPWALTAGGFAVRWAYKGFWGN